MGFSKSEVDRAGRRLAERLELRRRGDLKRLAELEGAAVQEAELIIESWREHHARPLSSVAANLRYYVQDHGRPEVAQRLKRFRTIIDKLARERGMRLTQMADIGGVRAVLRSQDAANQVASRLRRNWTIVRYRDYVAEPKEDGYRAIHLVARRWGRLIEVQLRTPFQHLWANLIEEESRRVGFDLKSGRGPAEILDMYRQMADGGATLEAEARLEPEMVALIQALFASVDRFTREAKRKSP